MTTSSATTSSMPKNIAPRIVRACVISYSRSLKRRPPDEVQAVTEKAMDLYKRIVAGADFAELAREYSEGAGRADGGDIGWVNSGNA